MICLLAQIAMEILVAIAKRLECKAGIAIVDKAQAICFK